MVKFKVLLGVLLLFLASCSQKYVEPIIIAINPWPGYELLYLAERKGFFKQLGLPIKLAQLSSLSDVQRAYMTGRVDGMTSTLIEVVQAAKLGSRDLEVVLVPDYSNGGDVIVANKDIIEIKDLKGKKLGCEVSSLGIFIAHRALVKNGLSIDDVELVNIAQLNGEKAMLDGTIDAYITYPPTSVSILKNSRFHQIFTSADIPFEVIDTISLSKEKIDQHPGIVAGIHKVWAMALEYMREHPQDAYEIMGDREGITGEEFEDVMQGLSILGPEEQTKIFDSPDKLQEVCVDVCNVLVQVGSLTGKCQDLPNLVYRGEI